MYYKAIAYSYNQWPDQENSSIIPEMCKGSRPWPWAFG